MFRWIKRLLRREKSSSHIHPENVILPDDEPDDPLLRSCIARAINTPGSVVIGQRRDDGTTEIDSL